MCQNSTNHKRAYSVWLDVGNKAAEPADIGKTNKNFMKTVIVWMLIAVSSNGSPPSILGTFPDEKSCLDTWVAVAMPMIRQNGIGSGKPIPECVKTVAPVKE